MEKGEIGIAIHNSGSVATKDACFGPASGVWIKWEGNGRKNLAREKECLLSGSLICNSIGVNCNSENQNRLEEIQASSSLPHLRMMVWKRHHVHFLLLKNQRLWIIFHRGKSKASDQQCVLPCDNPSQAEGCMLP